MDLKQKKVKGRKTLCMIRDGAFFVKLFKSIKELCTDIILKFTVHGMDFQGMDTSHVSMCMMHWDCDDIEIYNIDDKEEIKLGLSLENLNKILKLLPTKGAIELWIQEGQCDKLNIRMMNDEKDEINVTMNLMDIDTEELSVPEDLHYELNMQFDALKLKNIIRDVKDIADVVGIHFGKLTKLKTLKSDIGEVVCDVIPKNSEEIDENKSSVTTLALRYLTIFMEFQNCTDTVEINTSEDMPVQFVFKFMKKSGVVFFLAPQIED